MTFLARLIERHRADASASLPILEPRLPSRFERGAFAMGSRPAGWDAEAPRRSETRVPAVSRPAWVASRSASGGEGSVGEILRVGAARPTLTGAPATVRAPASRAMPDASASPSLLAEAGSAAPPAPSPTADRPASAPAPSSREGRPAAPPATSARPEVRPPVPSPRAVRAERDAPGARGEPTIHVTIGRVDVRAVMTPVAASPRPSAPVETQSLEDYLRGRTRGRP